MLHFNRHQMQGLEQRALDAFHQRTCAHLVQWFPRTVAWLSPQALDATIRLGLARARSHDLTPEPCVRCVIELTLRFGGDFDSDPLLPWASEVLGTDPHDDPLARADRLHEAGWGHAAQIDVDFDEGRAGATVTRIEALLRRLDEADPRPLDVAEAAVYRNRLAAALWALFPQRCTLLGDTAVQAHVERCALRAPQLGLQGAKGLALVALLAFVCGHRFDADPRLPQLGHALAVAGDGPRVDALLAQTLLALQRWQQLDRPAGHAAPH